MILNNMLALIESAVIGGIIPQDNSTGTTINMMGGSFPLKMSAVGTPYYISNRKYFVETTINTTYTHSFLRIYLGQGTNEPAVSDYTLTYDTECFCDIDSASLCKCANGVQTIVGNFYNNKETDLTFTELGLAIAITSSNNNSPLSTSPSTTTSNTSLKTAFQYSYGFLLLTRDLLETPVTVKAGETYTFTYKLDLSKLATEAS